MIVGRKLDWVGLLALIFGAAVVVPSILALIASIVAIADRLF